MTRSLDDLREAVATLEDTERIARRVLGGSHPLTTGMEENSQMASRAPFAPLRLSSINA